MSFYSDSLDGLQTDALREIANIGSGHAATAMSALLGRPIDQTVPKVQFIPIQEMPNHLGGAEKVVVASLLNLTGDVAGHLMMFLDLQQAERIISMMLNKPVRKTGTNHIRHFSALEKSVLSETINIMGGSYMSAIAEFTNLKIQPSIPYLSVDMVGAVLNIAAAEAGKSGDFAVFFQSELFNENERIIGDLLLIPDEKSCDIILESLGCK